MARDRAGKRVLTQEEMYHTLKAGKVVKMDTERGIDTVERKESTKSYLVASINGRGEHPVSELIEFYGSYHIYFGKAVFYPLNIAELVD